MIPNRRPLGKRLRALVWRVPIGQEVDEEIAAHLELQTRRYVAAGMNEADARAAAQARFGDIGRVGSECREIREHMEADMERVRIRQDLAADIGFALRTLRRSPLFTLVAAGTIALAIGANVAIFSVLDAVLIRPLPYRNAERAVTIWNANGTTPESRTAVAVPEYFDLAAELKRFDAVGAVRAPSSAVIDGAEPERVAAYIVTPNIFDLLGATPMLGRSFVEGDGALNAPAVVVLSHALWQRRFGADRTLVGKSVSISGVMRTVVGVMPPDIRFPDAPVSFLREPAELWVPTGWTQQRGDSRGNQILALLARLRPGVPLAQGQSELDRVAAGFRRAYPERYASATSKNWKLQAVPLREEMVGGVRDGLLIIAGAVGLVLLIACVNVANLLLARGATRQREFAIRQALGAGRGRLVRQLLTESVVLTFSGGIVGLALGWAGVRLLVAYGASGIPRVADATINANVLAVSFGLSVFSGIFVGLFPAIDRSLGGGRAASSATTRGATAGRHRLRSVLVSAQVAMALVVLVAAGLLTRSFVALEQVKLGFDAEHVASFQLTTPRVKYDSLSKVVAFYEQIQTAIASLPGVSSASAVYPLPMSDDGWSGSFRVDGEPDGPNDPIPHAEYAATMPGYFRTLGIRLISGREFAATDVKGSPAVVVVDEQLAREHWPHESAINKRIGSPGQWMTVIGVVGHVHNAGPRTSGEPQLYLPFLQNPQSTMSIVARSDASVASLAPALRTAVYAVDRAMPVAKLRPVSEFVTAGFAKQRFDMLLIAAFAVTALVLAMVGLYGVIAYLVTQRTREIGIRMALGGRASSIKVMVLREGIFITLTGILVGGAAAVLLTRLLAEQLFAVSTFDPLTYVTIACALAVVAVVASYGPARRATEIDPMAALRD